MNTFNNRIKYFFMGLFLPLASLSTAHADDTEVFYLSGDSTPKIMMILDTSLSMAFNLPGNNTSKENRITVMKEAMTDFITDASGIDVGIMRTNQFTGAIVYPISSLDSSTTETITRFDRPTTDNRNNAVEVSNGNVTIDTREKGNKITNNHLNFKNNSYIGLRFNNIVIPQGHKVKNAYLQVTPYTNCTIGKCDNLSIKIKGEKTSNSAIFTETKNNLKDRYVNTPTTSTYTSFLTGWHGSYINSNSTLTTPSNHYIIDDESESDKLTAIVQEIVNQSDWKSGNALSLIIDSSSNTEQKENGKVYGGILNAPSFFGTILYIEIEPYTRTISNREKLLEELDNQQLALYTPTVPALYESLRYLTGSALEDDHNSKFNTSRSGDYKQKERIPHPLSFTGGSLYTPYGSTCQEGWLNAEDCILREIQSNSPTPKPYYQTNISDTCSDDEASIIILSDGAAFHSSGSNNSGKWWSNMKADIGRFIDSNIGINSNKTCSSGNGNNNDAQNCGFELAEQMQLGLNVSGLTDKQKVKLYTIGFDDDTSTWLETMATKGGGTYQTATDSAGLINAFNVVSGDVISDSVTFSNTSVSLNTSNQLNHNSNLYYSLFTPSNLASWRGNLKRYKLGGNGKILDETGAVAIDEATGLFTATSSSYWSPTVDGFTVTKGGVTEQLKNSTQARKIYINHDSGLTLLNNSSNPDITFNDFGLTTDSQKQQYINNMLTNDSIADPLHSTPVEVSYTNDGSVIFFGDNEGYVHAIEADTGKELWAFMPKELLVNQSKVLTNIESANHIYGVDGNIVSWTDGSNKYITFGMRRGGSSYYTLNVTNKSTPTFQWKISSGDTNFTNLGQTWSTPVKTKIINNSTTKSVLIFAGGYDTQQDNVDIRTNDNIGDSLYIIDALTANVILKEDNLGYSIPSDIKAIDIDGDSAADQIYVGDMGGRLLRFTIDGSSSLNTHIVANLADDDAQNNRRFYHAPDVSVRSENSSSALAIAIGSGYRAHPNNDTINDNFYMIKQPLHVSGTPTIITESSLLESEVTIDAALLATKNGWYIPLRTSGEKALSSSTTADGEIFFTTFEPNLGINSCATSSGTSRLYRVSVDDGNAVYKDTFPDVTDGDVDKSTDCTTATCGDDDRFVEVEGASILSTPIIIHGGGDEPVTTVNSGTNTFELPSRKTKMNFWRQE